VKATNTAGEGTQTLTITVAAKANTPVITNASDPVVAYIGDDGFSYKLETDPANPAVSSYTLTGTLPAGLTFDSATGTFDGVATTTGESTVKITATNANGTSAPVTLVIKTQVEPPAPGPAPAPAAEEPKSCGYGSGLSALVLMIMASLSLMRITRCRPDHE
jgi:hypothetical protein